MTGRKGAGGRRLRTPAEEIEAGRRAFHGIPGAELAKSYLAEGLNYFKAMRRFSRVLIEASLVEHNYDKAASGRQLGLTRDSVRRIARETQL